MGEGEQDGDQQGGENFTLEAGGIRMIPLMDLEARFKLFEDQFDGPAQAITRRHGRGRQGDLRSVGHEQIPGGQGQALFGDSAAHLASASLEAPPPGLLRGWWQVHGDQATRQLGVAQSHGEGEEGVVLVLPQPPRQVEAGLLGKQRGLGFQPRQERGPSLRQRPQGGHGKMAQVKQKQIARLGVSSEVLSTIPLIGGVAIGQLLMDKGGGFEVVAEL